MLHQRMRRQAAAVAASMMLIMPLAGCEGHKQLDDATKVSDTGAQTFDGLAAYYGKLAQGSQDFTTTYVARVGQPAPDSEQAKAMADHLRIAASYRMRQELCLAIKGLYASMHRISTSTPEDTQKAAESLHTAALKFKGFPAQASVFSTAIPAAAMSQAVNGLISDIEDLQKIRDVKRGNADVLDVLDRFQIIYRNEQFKYAQDREQNAKEQLAFTQWAITYHLVSTAPMVQSFLNTDQLKASDLSNETSDKLANQIALDHSGPTPVEATAEAQALADSITAQIEAQHRLAGEMQKNPAF